MGDFGDVSQAHSRASSRSGANRSRRFVRFSTMRAHAGSSNALRVSLMNCQSNGFTSSVGVRTSCTSLHPWIISGAGGCRTKGFAASTLRIPPARRGFEPTVSKINRLSSSPARWNQSTAQFLVEITSRTSSNRADGSSPCASCDWSWPCSAASRSRSTANSSSLRRRRSRKLVSSASCVIVSPKAL